MAASRYYDLHTKQHGQRATLFEGRAVRSCYPAVSPEIAAVGGTYVDLPMDKACVDGSLVTAPAWPAHPAWLSAFLDVTGAKIEVGKAEPVESWS